jgi:hypothetical protein
LSTRCDTPTVSQLEQQSCFTTSTAFWLVPLAVGLVYALLVCKRRLVFYMANTPENDDEEAERPRKRAKLAVDGLGLPFPGSQGLDRKPVVRHLAMYVTSQFL